MMEKALIGLKSSENSRSVRAVAADHGVLPSSLYHRFSGRPARSGGHKGRQYLTADEESSLAKHVVKLLGAGFPPLVALVRTIATGIHDRARPQDKRPVCRGWASRFVDRHSELAIAWSKVVKSARISAASPDVLRSWLEHLQELRVEYNVAPGDIYNMDEKGPVLGRGARQTGLQIASGAPLAIETL